MIDSLVFSQTVWVFPGPATANCGITGFGASYLTSLCLRILIRQGTGGKQMTSPIGHFEEFNEDGIFKAVDRI